MKSACYWPPANTLVRASTIRGSTRCYLTLPVSWRGTIAQYVGRLHRLHEDKTEVRVYDYADLNVPMLSRMFDRRCQSYEAVGYRVMLPGSAVPGWPVDVPLPVDPQWKTDYAATVRRLVRDGVDVPLAKLFVHVAREFDPSAEGVARARSATEAFFYRRLQSLPETTGRFELNVELPIPFDGWGNMEVDLLDSRARLVIELDGGQHFRKCRRLSPRPPQGCAAAGTRLFRFAVSSPRRRQAAGQRARHDPPSPRVTRSRKPTACSQSKTVTLDALPNMDDADFPRVAAEIAAARTALRACERSEKPT